MLNSSEQQKKIFFYILLEFVCIAHQCRSAKKFFSLVNRKQKLKEND
jgi:hypothetical protein